MKNTRLYGLLLALVTTVTFAAASSGPISIQAIQWWFKSGIYVGSASTASTANKVTKILSASATIDFTTSTAGHTQSSSITVTGATAGDPCFVGVPTAAAALKANFSCQVDATNSVKVYFEPTSVLTSTCTLDGSTPSVCPAQTVVASSTCTCSPVGTTAAIAAGGCAVSLSSTTLTITSLAGGSHVINYTCRAPVDPASGTFFVTVLSSQ